METITLDTVYALARSGGRLYAARASGLYHSQDDGKTWVNTLPSVTVTAIAETKGRLFAGVNGAVLLSDDSGESWHTSALASPPPAVTAIACSPQWVAAGTAQDGVFVSADHGGSWTPWNFGLVDRSIYTLAWAGKDTLYAGTESGVFRSHNGGKSWRETAFPMDAAPVLSLVYSGKRLFAGTEKNGVSISDDGGVRWTSLYPSGGVNSITLSDQLHLLLEDQWVCSSDGGKTWQVRAIFPSTRLAMTMLLDHDTALIGFAGGEITAFR